MITIRSEGRKKEIAREKMLFRYNIALEQGNLETIGSIWQAAEQDQVLERMLFEFHDTSPIDCDNYEIDLQVESEQEDDINVFQSLDLEGQFNDVVTTESAELDLDVNQTDFGYPVSTKPQEAFELWSKALQEALSKPASVPPDNFLLPDRSNRQNSNKKRKALPEKIDGYRIVKELGRGASGVVYLAQDTNNREIALKVLNQNVKFSSFRPECKTVSQLNHPHIIEIYDINLDTSPPYVAMEYLKGGTLKDHLEQGRILSWEEAIKLIKQICEGLTYAHSKGFTHQDIKPSNILFSEEGSVRLSDFGSVHCMDNQVREWETNEEAENKDKQIDARTDIYALGALAFEMLTGSLLDQNKSQVVIPGSSLKGKLRSLLETNLLIGKTPLEGINIIKRAFNKDQQSGYQDSQSLLVDIQRHLDRLQNKSRQDIGEYHTWTDLEDIVSTEVPIIQCKSQISLSGEIEAILRKMFSDSDKLLVEAELTKCGNSQVYLVRTIRSGTIGPAMAIKIGPGTYIRKEWLAYQSWIKDELPDNAAIASRPVLDPVYTSGGLSYDLIGHNGLHLTFQEYYLASHIADICWVLNENLLQVLAKRWWSRSWINQSFQMKTDYDFLLPPNLIIEVTDIASEATPYLIKSDRSLPSSIHTGCIVQVTGFVVTEIDTRQQILTLNNISNSCRLLSVNVPDITDFKVGRLVDFICGRVIATRQEILMAQADKVFEGKLDLSTERIRLSDGLNLPNPLATIEDIWAVTPRTVNMSIIHGDLNLENILVDPIAGDVRLIDFSNTRQGHVLHDLLRLETEVVTKIIPQILINADLSIETIYPFYNWLHQVMSFQEDYLLSLPLPQDKLEDPYRIILTIREIARKYLYHSYDWSEYYYGLIIYLLNALNSKYSDQQSITSLSKQVAFWGAAAIRHLLMSGKADMSAAWTNGAAAVRAGALTTEGLFSVPVTLAEITKYLSKLRSASSMPDTLAIAGSIPLELVNVPAGEFLMGSAPTEDQWTTLDEQSQHRVYASEFSISKYPVTNAQYAVFVKETNYTKPYYWDRGQIPTGKENHPVVGVSWYDAVAYCEWLTEKTGNPFRLPTEAEWEKTARGTEGRIYPWGNDWDAVRCNTREAGPSDTTPVGSYPTGASSYGALDMAGNVWEWCADWYDQDEYQHRAKRIVKDPQGPKTGIERVLRGGSWHDNVDRVRCTTRHKDMPEYRFGPNIGYRVVISSSS